MKLKRTAIASLTLLLLAIVIFPAVAEEDKLPDPTPPLESVDPDKMIKPEEGIGSVKFGDSIQRVEEFFGRGEIVPEEPDFTGNSIVNLFFTGEGLIFKFFNGKLAMIVIDKPGYATKTGVQVGGDVGDLIREFGSDYQMSKSLIPEEGTRYPDYEIMFKNIAASVKGNVILKLRIKIEKK